MRHFPFALLVAAVLPAALCAQDPTPQATPAAPVCTTATTIEQLPHVIDEAVSGPAGKDRTCMRQILLPEARLIPVAIAADGSATPHVLTVEGWIEAVRKRGDMVFYERQVKIKSEVYGHVAHLWSTYEVRPTPDGKATVRGINSIQAVYDGKQWRVMEILWQAETAAEPVPEKYLP